MPDDVSIIDYTEEERLDNERAKAEWLADALYLTDDYQPDRVPPIGPDEEIPDDFRPGWQAELAEILAADEAAAESNVVDAFAPYSLPVSIGGTDKLPAVWERDDGETLIYAGKISSLYGEPGSGKSWLALMAAIAAIQRGGRVCWWDFEDGPQTLARRAQLLGALELVSDPDKFRFLTPSLAESPAAIDAARQWLGVGHEPSLLVIDATESAGCPADGSNVRPWFESHVDPWRMPTIAVLLLDHVPKRREDRPKGAIGSQHKLARLDGAALYVSGFPWTKGKGGKIFIQNQKDRQGDLPAAAGQHVAVVVGDYENIGGEQCFGYRVEAPEAPGRAPDMIDALLGAIADQGPIFGARALRELVKGRGNEISVAADQLAIEGYIVKVPYGKGFQYTITPEGFDRLNTEIF